MRCCFCNRPLGKTELVARYGPGPDAHCPLSCKWCNAPLADPYLEQDGVLIFLDLVLHKPAAYRHLLFNSHLTIDGNKMEMMWFTGRLFGLLLWFWWYSGERAKILSIPCFLLPVYILTWTLFQKRPEFLTFMMAVQLAQFARLHQIVAVIFGYHSSGPNEYDWLVNIFCFTSTVEAIMAVCHLKHGLEDRRGIELPKAYFYSYASVLVGAYCQYHAVMRISA